MDININFKQLSPKSWLDFEKLFGEKGACGGCWCMYWRLTNKDFKINKGADNKEIMLRNVNEGKQIGIIMYLNDEPVGWCSFAPREDFIRLANSKILKPVDSEKVWSITCFFIDRKFRRKGYSVELLKGVIKFARKKKVKILEGYPVEPKTGKTGDAFLWTGTASAYSAAGFKEVVRRSETRPIMRYYL